MIDHGVIEQTARELEVYETEVEKHDEEYVESALSRILNRILDTVFPFTFMLAGDGTLFTPSSIGRDTGLPGDHAPHHHRCGNTGHVVIVGRGGQVLLADQRDVLHIRVVAPLELRVAYVARREGLDMDAARKRVQAKDRARTRYMQTQYHCQHEDPHLYDLVIILPCSIWTALLI